MSEQGQKPHGGALATKTPRGGGGVGGGGEQKSERVGKSKEAKKARPKTKGQNDGGGTGRRKEPREKKARQIGRKRQATMAITGKLEATRQTTGGGKERARQTTRERGKSRGQPRRQQPGENVQKTGLAVR